MISPQIIVKQAISFIMVMWSVRGPILLVKLGGTTTSFTRIWLTESCLV